MIITIQRFKIAYIIMWKLNVLMSVVKEVI